MMQKQCSDFDSDCFDISDPFHCWIGHPSGWSKGIYYLGLPVADGYCPLVKGTEKQEDQLDKLLEGRGE